MATFHHVMGIVMQVVFYIGLVPAIFMIMGALLPARRWKSTDKRYKYCFLIAAKNEERVIAQLIESIKGQDYPQELLTIFVCADCCTDKTAEVARAAGAIVYERSQERPKEFASKGNALDYMLKCIGRDYENGIENWDGAFMFDADNLLSKNYVSEYNKAFAYEKYDFYNSMINSSNWGTNFISAYCSNDCCAGPCLYVLSPKAMVGVSHAARGRGVLYRTYMLRHGWKWKRMTIDADMSAELISKGYQSSYVHAAQMFEEQPFTLKIMFRQRMRYAKGLFRVFWLRSWQMAWGVLLPYDYGSKKYRRTRRRFSIKHEFQKRLSNLAHFCNYFPYQIFVVGYVILYPLVTTAVFMITKDPHAGIGFAQNMAWFFAMFSIQAVGKQLAVLVRFNKYARIHPMRAIFYLFLCPFLELIVLFVRFYALFVPVKWKTIPHVLGTDIQEVQEQKTIGQHMHLQGKTPDPSGHPL